MQRSRHGLGFCIIISLQYYVLMNISQCCHPNHGKHLLHILPIYLPSDKKKTAGFRERNFKIIQEQNLQ